MNKFLAFVGGLLGGAIVGAVTALLLTPSSGGDLKQQARRRYNDMQAEGRKAAEARRAEVIAEFEALKRGGAPT
jgi:gas vesicle protein